MAVRLGKKFSSRKGRDSLPLSGIGGVLQLSSKPRSRSNDSVICPRFSCLSISSMFTWSVYFMTGYFTPCHFNGLSFSAQHKSIQSDRLGVWLFRPFAGSPPGLFAPWLIRFAPCLVHPLADSPSTPVEYTCDSLLRLVFVFQFTERQQASNRQTTVDNHSNSSTVLK